MGHWTPTSIEPTDYGGDIELQVYITSIFTRLMPGKLKELGRSHADLSYSF